MHQFRNHKRNVNAELNPLSAGLDPGNVLRTPRPKDPQLSFGIFGFLSTLRHKRLLDKQV